MAGNGKLFVRTKGPRLKTPAFLRLFLLAGLLLALAVGLMDSEAQRGGPEHKAAPAKAMAPVRLGIENLAGSLELFRGKRVGLITNATGVDSRLRRSVDILKEQVNLVVLLAPEHGLRGNVVAGAAVPHETDVTTGLPIFSLHGNNRKPTAEMLKDIDVLAFDIQDIGARSYTYIYTMAYAMQSAKEQGKLFVVFDRPNPLGGDKVEGGILKPDFSSFIGLYPIPVRHGLTVGELARLFNEEFGIGTRLAVVPMLGWSRAMQQEDTGLPWVMTSPNIPTPDSARVYSGTGLFGGSNVSEGIGTTRPFELVGAPWLDGPKLAERMNSRQLPGVYFRPVYFTPQWGKYQGRTCSGVQLHVTDRRQFEPVRTGLNLLEAIRLAGGPAFKWNQPKGKDRWMIDLYAGGTELRDGKPGLTELWARWAVEAEEFRRRSLKYRLYP
jgi:uncharacterized protein YbbC (DUF1343 family)